MTVFYVVAVLIWVCCIKIYVLYIIHIIFYHFYFYYLFGALLHKIQLKFLLILFKTKLTLEYIKKKEKRFQLFVVVVVFIIFYLLYFIFLPERDS